MYGRTGTTTSAFTCVILISDYRVIFDDSPIRSHVSKQGERPLQLLAVRARYI